MTKKIPPESGDFLAPDRFAKYLAKTGGNREEAMRLYAWNTAVSAAFYAPLQALEITLRNQVHKHLTEKYGIQWYKSSNINFREEHRQQVKNAEDREKGELPSAPPSNVVAYLAFGFWVVLLSKHYDESLWRPALYKAFPYTSGTKRYDVHRRFEDLREFRNRIAHHRPIFNVGENKGKNLSDFYQEILEAINWMSPKKREWVETHSRIKEVLAQSPNDPNIRF
ncbi:MAG: Abi family protein [Hyphomicrobiales bacterium]|nr:Abi family protein [Hyphomicrobiales bacterium]